VLSGSRGEADAAADYRRRRDEATLPEYHANVEKAALGPAPPDLLALRAAVRGDQEATNRLMLVGEGLLAPAGLGSGQEVHGRVPSG
jgi:hypothetical protein